MRRRTVLWLVAIVGCAILIALGLAIWSLPPQFLPEVVYRWKFGGKYPAQWRVGDGTFIDVGPRVGFGRFIVDLGPVDSGLRFERTYEIGPLPREAFTIGFEVIGPADQTSMKFKPPEIGEVQVEITTEAGEQIVRDGGPLSKWSWSGPLSWGNYAFVYQTLIPRGDAHTGTAFTTSPGGRYNVRVRADWKPGVPEAYQIRLQIHGGGWKAGGSEEAASPDRERSG